MEMSGDAPAIDIAALAESGSLKLRLSDRKAAYGLACELTQAAMSRRSLLLPNLLQSSHSTPAARATDTHVTMPMQFVQAWPDSFRLRPVRTRHWRPRPFVLFHNAEGGGSGGEALSLSGSTLAV